MVLPHTRRVTYGTSKTKKHVCLFGLSADPPTGVGGHAGIVRALRKLQCTHSSKTTGHDDCKNEDDHDGCDCDGKDGMHEDDRQSSLPKPPSHDNSAVMEPSRPYRFDEVWILPVYRHTFQVRNVGRPLSSVVVPHSSQAS